MEITPRLLNHEAASVTERNTKEHWEKIYRAKQPNELSWWQDNPKTSLDLIHSLSLPPSAHIIDIGGGDSTLVDFLLADGFENITVLDISERALERAKTRLGKRAGKVQWIAGDINEFKPPQTYDLWHDRATFHFLTTEQQITHYVDTAREALKSTGSLLVGTFSTEGPRTCSGLPVTQYDEETLTSALRNGFEKIRCIREDHVTPFNTRQNFLFCSYQSTKTYSQGGT